MAQLSEPWLATITILLPELRDRHPHLVQVMPLAEPTQRQHFFEALARALLGDGQPLLLIFDDMQWCDRETLEWLRYLLHFAPQAQLLIVMTVRAGEVAADHPLHSFMLSLRRQQLLSEIPLERLNQWQTATLVVQLAGRTLAADQAARLYRHTEGNPFFVVEMVRADMANLSVGSEQAPNANEFEALREKRI